MKRCKGRREVHRVKCLGTRNRLVCRTSFGRSGWRHLWRARPLSLCKQAWSTL